MINRVKVFELEQSAYQPNKYIMLFHPDLFHCESTTGSFALMPARLLNISYADYCRFCRDVLGAEIVGKGNQYPVVYFKKNQDSLIFVRLLNARANYLLWEIDNPDWEKHQQELAEREAKWEELKHVSKTK